MSQRNLLLLKLSIRILGGEDNDCVVKYYSRDRLADRITLVHQNISIELDNVFGIFFLFFSFYFQRQIFNGRLEMIITEPLKMKCYII